jgi:hypothetical protein
VTRRKATTHTVTWTHPITGKPRRLELTHTRDYLHAGSDHLEIRSIKPRDAAQRSIVCIFHDNLQNARVGQATVER